MDSAIRILCPSCHARIKAPAQLLGKMRDCPKCSERFFILRPPPEDCGPALLCDESTAPVRKPDRTKPREKVILLADDDRELNNGLRAMLEKRGHRVIQAFDGIQATELVGQEQPDLMILDVMMPHMGGYPVLEHLQNKPKAPPVIMMTANEGGHLKTRAEEFGVVDYLRKPFPTERLLSSVDKGLDRRQAELAALAAE
jgi:CheY-like chemotaxis protein